MKRKREASDDVGCDVHVFKDDQDHREVCDIRTGLLKWYDANKRTMPWRSMAEQEHLPEENRLYAVWVSEIMLQQTQVATVIDYYNRWMAKWPTIKDLALATEEEVNQMWSGLGYYSRGRRLLEGAKKVEAMESLPKSAEDLQKSLPGVGRYTASAVASIVFKEPVGVVDGNVIRVLARMRKIGHDSSSNLSMDVFWENANHLVDVHRPGDFNQAMMELGATICTPKNPKCTQCPVKSHCLAYSDAKSSKPPTGDIEDCQLCLKPENYIQTDGVCNYPRKTKKAPPSVKKTLVIALQHQGKYLLNQRPKTGLLANLLEFPHLMDLEEVNRDISAVEVFSEVKSKLGLDIAKIVFMGEIFHQFSHIRQTYVVWKAEVLKLDTENESGNATLTSSMRWVNSDEVETSAISTAMLKVFKLINKKGKRQQSIKSFFNRK